MAKRLTLFIFIGLALGLLVGWVINAALADGTAAGQAQLATVAGYFSVVSNLFLRLIKMIIAPLVFATLVSGIVHMADTSALGRIGGRALAWFIGASFISLLLGLALVNIFKPGVGLALDLPSATASTHLATADFSIATFVTHLVPTSMFDAMANNEILQIVVLSLFVGVGITSLGSGGQRLAGLVEEMVAVMLKITEYVMRVAPVAVFAAVAAAVIERGVGIVFTFGYFIGVFYLGLAVLWMLLLASAWLLLRVNPFAMLRNIREPMLLAFSTASSEAAFPRTLEALDRGGVPRRISSFVLPLGYSFNLDGSMMYMAFAIMFIAQAYGIEMDLWQQFTVLMILMVTSKGVAGVPRASLVVVAATLSFVGLPEAGLLLVLAIDHFLDMGRTATNVVGNAVACTAVARWEGVLGAEDGRVDGMEPQPSLTFETEDRHATKT